MQVLNSNYWIIGDILYSVVKMYPTGENFISPDCINWRNAGWSSEEVFRVFNPGYFPA